MVIDVFIVNWPYFGIMTVLTGVIESGGSVQEGIEKMKNILPTCMLYSWSVWPVFVFCLYGIIPKYLRTIADNLFDAGWSTFFSWLQHRNIHH